MEIIVKFIIKIFYDLILCMIPISDKFEPGEILFIENLSSRGRIDKVRVKNDLK